MRSIFDFITFPGSSCIILDSLKRNSMPIDFIHGESANKRMHIFEKNDNSEKKLKKNEKFVFFASISFFTMTIVSAIVSYA